MDYFLEYNCSADNISDCKINEDFSTVSSWIFIPYYVLLGCGSVANLVHAFALFRTRRNGALSLILQLSLIDIVSIYVGLSEIATLNEKTWPFSEDTCPFFTGFEVFINSITLYLMICFNFHVISLWNLYELEMKKNRKNPLTSGVADDSNECLVTKLENSNRMVTIDYSPRKSDLSVILPAIFMWFISASLSIPNFALSTTLKISDNYTLCASVIDVKYSEILQNLLLAFKIVIPTIFLIISSIILIFSCIMVNKNQGMSMTSTKKYQEIRNLIIFAISLTFFYLVTSLQRQILHTLHTTTYNFSSNDFDNFRMPPLYNSHVPNSILTYLAMLHYSCPVFRSIVYFCLLPKFLVRNKMTSCFYKN